MSKFDFVSYDKLPEHMREGARLYVEEGVMPGSFLQAVLENNLSESFARADEINTANMKAWARWLHNDCPASAWGSITAINKWRQDGGLKGIDRRERV